MESQTDQIRISRQGGVHVVEFSESKLLDEVGIRRIGDQLSEVAASAERPRMVLDFAGVGHMSSSTLGMLIMLHKRIRERGGQMVLCNVCESIYKVFAITKLSEVFEIYDSRETAMAGLA